MLKKEHVEAVAKLLKMKPEDLTTAIADKDEVDITVPEGTLFAETEIETLKTNEYKRGSQAAVEIQVKDAKEKHGLEFKGKTLEGLIEAAQKKALQVGGTDPLNLTGLIGQSTGVKAGTYVTGLKLTGGGNNGSITIDGNGRITAITPAS